MAPFFYTLIAIVAYLFNPFAGFGVFCTLALLNYSLGEGDYLFRSLKLLIISLPLYMTPILPGLPVLGSWTTVMLIVVSTQLLNKRLRFKPLDLYLWAVFCLSSVVTILLSFGAIKEVYYTVQIALLFLPPSLALLACKSGRCPATKKENQNLLFPLAGAVAATAVGVLIQWVLHNRFGVSVGHIAFFQNRVTYDLLIPAYSAVSALLSIGLPMGPVLWRAGKPVAAIALPLLSGIAILVNTSRTGFVAGVFGLLIVLLFPPHRENRLHDLLLLVPTGGFMLWLFGKVANLSRFQSSNLWSGNGRLETYVSGYELWTQYPRYVLFGRGYADYPTTPPHNFLLETLVCSGLVVTMALAVWLLRFATTTWGTYWCHLFFTYAAASMFFSGFYNFKPLAILLVVAFLSIAPHKPTARQPVSLTSHHETSRPQKGIHAQ